MDYALLEHVDLSIRDDETVTSIKYYNEQKKADRVILITSAMGVKQHFYARFARFLAKHDWIVYTLDYSGIGLSRHKNMPKYNVDVIDWKDEIDQLIDHIVMTDEPDELCYIGHSLGGQIFGLLKDMYKFDKIVSITSQNGYWRYYGKFFFPLFWYILVPLSSHIFGYFPSPLFGMGEKIPKKVMLQWKRWCTQEDYLFGDENIDAKHGEFENPVLFWSFDDDPYAPREAVEYMINKFTATNPEHRHLSAADINLEEIGHFGFFKKKSEILWKKTIDWLNN